MPDFAANTSEPLVTILMPVRNEARFIRRSLESVLAQSYSHERMEILVVDGMSEDGTREIIQGVITDRAKQFGIAKDLAAVKDTGRSDPRPVMRMIDNPSSTVPIGLNIGLEEARGDVIFRLDGHSEMSPDYVRNCVSRLQERPDIACVGGPSVAVGGGAVGKAYALALRSPFGVGGRTFRTLQEEAYVDTLAFGGYRRAVFCAVGGFNPQLKRNQDIEFSARLRRAGHSMLLIQSARTFYHGPERFQAVVKQGYKNGYWNLNVSDKMTGVLSWRHFVPGIFVASLLIISVLAPFLREARLALLSLASSYALACMLATVVVLLKSRQRTALLLPIIFTAMHISYGVGSVVGGCEYAFGALRKSIRMSAG